MAVITETAAETTFRRLFPRQDSDDTSAMPDAQNNGNGKKLTKLYLWLMGCIYVRKKVNPKKGKHETSRRQYLQHGKISNLTRLGQFRCLPYLLFLLLLMIKTIAASATQVSETECETIFLHSVTLDADEVRRVTKNGDKWCNFSGRGYTSVSDDAFYHVRCELIDLSGNNISHLPEDLFSLAPRLIRIDLTGNQFCEAPVIKNAVVQTIILDQNPVISIPENYTDHLPKLHVMYLENCLFPFEINVRAFSCGCVKNPIQIFLDGTVNILYILSCPEYVMVTAEKGDYSPSVTVTCGNGSQVTFESVNRTVWNEIVATTIDTTLDLGTPYSTIPSEISTPETPTDSQNLASTQVVSYIFAILVPIIFIICLCFCCLFKFKGSCKQQRNLRVVHL